MDNFNLPSSYTANNPTELCNIIKTSLGYPVINIEVADEQIFMCIHKALELFSEYHFNGTNKTYQVISITDKEGTRGVFDLRNRSIFAITQIIRSSRSIRNALKTDSSALWVWDIVRGFATPGSNCGFGSNGANIFGGDLSYMEQVFQRQKMLEEYLDPLPDFWYNDSTGQLQIFDNINVGDIIVVEAWVKPYPETPSTNSSYVGGGYAGIDSKQTTIEQDYHNPNLAGIPASYAGGYDPTVNGSYNNRWVKEYATNLVKYLHGNILAKHQNTMNIGGTTIDGLRMMDQAQNEMDKLREELEELDIPVGIIMG